MSVASSSGARIGPQVGACGGEPSSVPVAAGGAQELVRDVLGSLTDVPKDRLLRIGFGLFLDPGTFECTGMGTGCTNRRVPLSTTHQFRLPRRR